MVGIKILTSFDELFLDVYTLPQQTFEALGQSFCNFSLFLNIFYIPFFHLYFFKILVNFYCPVKKSQTHLRLAFHSLINYSSTL